MAQDPGESLIGVPRDKYGPEYAAHLLDQYKLYVSMADKISERRQTANAFFSTINTALFATLGIVLPRTEGWFGTAWYVIVGAAGLVLCYSWYRLLRSYRDINSAKFKVVHEIERLLPIRPYDTEWTSVGCGDNPKLYLPFTHIETKIPGIFGILYLALIVVALISRA